MQCYKFAVRRLRLMLALAALALLAPAAAAAYSWPIQPFYQQHAIRGYFNDPRLAGPEQGFHFGVDIVAPDHTPVYAVTSGYARVRGMRVSVVPWRRGVPRLSYWHVMPLVAHGQYVMRRQLIGHVEAGAGHLHLAEWKNGTYINPLRIGGLAPYIDDTVPQLPRVTFYIGGLPVPPQALSGVIEITVDSFDTSPLPLPPPEWAQGKLAPALIRWQIVQGESMIRPWVNAVDFRRFLVPFSFFDSVYAPGTYQNRPNRPGRYEYFLAHDFDTRVLPNGSYVLQVEALDEQENVGRASFPFTVANPF
jgi:murein DD-endopeptidase MepM/ murein hydrolase activator NlpD